MEDPRGKSRDYDNLETLKLDILAKILCKGVYTSVVKHANPAQQDIYVVYPLGEIYNYRTYSIKTKDMKNIQNVLKNQDKKDDESIKTELFNIAKTYKNSFIGRIQQNHENSLSEQLRKQEITQDEYNTRSNMDHSETYKNKFLSVEDIKQLRPLNFNDSHHPRTLKKIPDQQGVVEYSNVHTEAIGIYYLSTKHGQIKHMTKEYLIGLGNKSGRDVGCCAGCTIEFTILEGEKGYKIHRTRDFPGNHPQNDYKPSPSITTDKYGKFITENGERIDIIGYTHEEDATATM